MEFKDTLPLGQEASARGEYFTDPIKLDKEVIYTLEQLAEHIRKQMYLSGTVEALAQLAERLNDAINNGQIMVQNNIAIKITSTDTDSLGNINVHFSDGTTITIPKGQKGDDGTLSFSDLTEEQRAALLKGVLTKSLADIYYQPKGNYATKEELASVSSGGSVDLSNYLTKTTANLTYQPKGNYLTTIPSEYVTETELQQQLGDINTILAKVVGVV